MELGSLQVHILCVWGSSEELRLFGVRTRIKSGCVVFKCVIEFSESNYIILCTADPHVGSQLMVVCERHPTPATRIHARICHFRSLINQSNFYFFKSPPRGYYSCAGTFSSYAIDMRVTCELHVIIGTCFPFFKNFTQGVVSVWPQ